MTAIVVEFRVIAGASKDADRFLSRADMPQVPTIGELINIDGDPYVVHERSWAIDNRRNDCRLYAYLRLTRLAP